MPPDAKAARIRRPLPTDRRVGCAVPNEKLPPWCRSASTAMISRRLPIAIAEVAGPWPIPNPSGLPILPLPTRSLRLWLKRKLTGCDLLHIRFGRVVLNVRNGPEDLPIVVRSAGRHRHRLRPDCHRRWRCPGRSDLSPPDLIQRGIAVRNVCRPWHGCARGAMRFRQRERFSRVFHCEARRAGTPGLPKPVKHRACCRQDSSTHLMSGA